MGRLTHEIVKGIRAGYWSDAEREELIERLAEYEDICPDPEVLWKIWTANITPNMVKQARDKVARCE